MVCLYDMSNMGYHTFDVSLLSNEKKGTLVHVLPGKVDENVKMMKKKGSEVGYSRDPFSQ